MANLRDIRRRIRSIKNTSQITRAMQLVAASKMQRAQSQALAGRPYAEELAEILAYMRRGESDLSHPFLEERPVRRRGFLVIGTDKGLCGALNANLFRLLAETPRESYFVSVGRKALQFLGRSGRTVEADFQISDKIAFGELRPAVDLLVEAFRKEEVDTVEVVYNRFVNTLTQEPVIATLLPLTGLDAMIERARSRGTSHTAEPPMEDDGREIHFEPSAGALLDNLLALFIRREVYQMALESKASEHSARMVAMKAATDNAKSLIEDLTLDYNKARQAAITQEIQEIAAAVQFN